MNGYLRVYTVNSIGDIRSILKDIYPILIYFKALRPYGTNFEFPFIERNHIENSILFHPS